MERAHKKLDVWKMSIQLAKAVYDLTGRYPKEEQYGIISQMRRAATSVPANIAEGAARRSTKEFVQFLSIAGGSLSELDTFLELSLALGYIKAEEKSNIDGMITNVSKTLAGLIRSLAAKNN
ncbi:four helix bundle protein [candidate division TA06 bacterium]|uniref:Four helix bundle protein n=1 Tax=candidate division TA06 bacterium TaxID=2250710 RepID=A0A933ICR2_UNCT6|nr:four helix bundle protein [candidate division TA06 bacterium]